MIILIKIYYTQTKKDLLEYLDSDTFIPLNISNDSFQINAQMLINHFSDFLCIKDKDGRWLGASEAYLKIFNLHDVNYVGKTDAELFHYSNSNSDILKVSFTQDKSAWHLKRPVKETRIVTLDHEKKTLEMTRIPIFDSKRNQLKMIVTGHFISLNDKKKNQLELLPKVFETCHLNFIFLDKDLKITDVNNAVSTFTGYSSHELIGKPLSFIVKGKLSNLQADFFSANTRRFWSTEMQCLTKKGHYFPVKLEVSEIIKEDRSVVYFANILDISQQNKDKKEIKQLSHYDKLTGLFNRTTFYNQLSEFIKYIDTTKSHGIIFLIDLDRFKIINESLGHKAGDELLKVVANRLQESIGANDIVARMSGDEFAILILSDKASYEDVYFEATKLAGSISRRLSEVIHVNNHEAFIGSSIGISIYSENATNKTEWLVKNEQPKEFMLKAERLLKNTDLARKKAKTEGKNKYEFYEKYDNDNNTAHKKHLIELNLRKAIAKNELQLYYQPQYDIKEKKLCGVEVLVRWLSNNERMIPPDQFITIAEDTGLIIDIGYWILRTACIQLKTWIDAGYPLTQVSVNVSSPQFNDPNFLDLVDKALLESKLTTKIDLVDKTNNTLQKNDELKKTSYLEFEITESILIGDTKFIDNQLKELKNRGIKLALDDFGTGYSSLSYLKKFPIDMLKIDKSFVDDITIENDNNKIVRAIINLGKSLDQKVIAEGVQYKNQLDVLRRNDCDIIQGYLFSQPLSAENMTEFFKTGVDEFHEKISQKPETKASFEP